MNGLWRDSIRGAGLRVVYGGEVDVSLPGSRWREAAAIGRLARRSRSSQGIRLGIDEVHASVLYRNQGVSLAVQVMMQQSAVSSLAGPEGVVLRIGADEMAYQAICRPDGLLLSEAVAVVDHLPVPPDGCRVVVIDCGGAVVPKGEPLPESSSLTISPFKKAFRTHSLPTLYAKARLPHWTQGAALAACLALVMGVSLVPFRAVEQTPLHPPAATPPALAGQPEAAATIAAFGAQLEQVLHGGLLSNGLTRIDVAGAELVLTGSWARGAPKLARRYAAMQGGAFVLFSDRWEIRLAMRVQGLSGQEGLLGEDITLDIVFAAAERMLAPLQIDPAGDRFTWTLTGDAVSPAWMRLLAAEWAGLRASVSVIECAVGASRAAPDCTIRGEISYEV